MIYIPKQFNSVILIDFSSMLYRYYFSSLKSRSFNTEAYTYYFIAKNIIKLREEYKNSYIIIVHDCKKGSLKRRKILKTYKTGREKTRLPGTIYDSLYSIINLFNVMSISYIQIQGYEADDVIFNLCCLIDCKIFYLVTYDKDLLQVCNISKDKDFYFIFNELDSFKKVEMRSYCIEKFGIHSSLLVEYFSIVGDSSDKIQGIRGLGPAFIKKHIIKHKKLGNVIDHGHSELSFKEKELITKGIKSYLVSKRLFIPQIINNDLLVNSNYLDNIFEIKDLKYYLSSIGWSSLLKI